MNDDFESLREKDLKSKLVVNVEGNQIYLEQQTSVSSLHTSENTSKKSGIESDHHKFTFDFSYWSHDEKDAHFVDQDQVR